MQFFGNGSNLNIKSSSTCRCVRAKVVSSPGPTNTPTEGIKVIGIVAATAASVSAVAYPFYHTNYTVKELVKGQDRLSAELSSKYNELAARQDNLAATQDNLATN